MSAYVGDGRTPHAEPATDSEFWPTWRCMACDRVQAIPEDAHIEPARFLVCIDCGTAFRLLFHPESKP